MALITRRITRTSQPQELVGIDWSNPISNGLLFVQVGDRVSDILNTSHTSTFSSPSTGAAGRSTAYSGTRAVWGAPSNPSRWTGALSVGAIVSPEVFYADAAFVGYNTSNGGSNSPIEFGSYDASGALKFGRANASGYRVWASPSGAIQANRITAVVGTQEANIGTAPKFYSGGIQRGAASEVYGGSGYGLASVGTAAFNTGGRTDGTSLFYGSTFLIVAWDRELSASEAISWSENPWQLFAPIEEQVWIPDAVSAGGPATVISIGVSATGSVGTPTATGAAKALPSGVSATASVGTPTAVAGTAIPATATPAGVSAASSVGTPTANGASIAYAGGISAFAAVGTPVAIGGSAGTATALPIGVQAIGYVGTPTVTAAAIVYAYGAQATSYVGRPVALGDPVAYAPSVYIATSPAQSYTVLSPAQSYTVTVQPQTYIS